MKRVKLISQLKVIFCVFVICFAQLIIGCTYVFASTLFSQLHEPTSQLKLTEDEESWIASITVIICPVGLLVTGILTDKIGRKKVMQITYIPLVISYLILAFAKSFKSILIARIILGFPFGSSTCEYLYIAEISPVKLRPVFFSLVTLFVGIGMLAEWILAIFFTWNTIAGIMCTMSVVGLVLTTVVPDSPMWLRAQGRTGEADKIDKWFGMELDDVNASDDNVATGNGSRNVTASKDDANGSRNVTGSKDDANGPATESYNLSTFLDSTVWKPTLITMSFLFLQQWGGVYVLLSYSVNVLRDCKIRWDNVIISAFLAGARVVGGIAFSLLYRVKRKTLMVTSGVGAAVSLLVVIGYMRVCDGLNDPPYGFVPIVAFVMYVFFNLLGILPLPWILCGEVFPMAVKGTLNGVVQTWGYVAMFMVIKVYPSIVSHYGVDIIWSIFAVSCIINTLFGVFIMPETKDKTLDDILSSFKKQNKNSIINLS